MSPSLNRSVRRGLLVALALLLVPMIAAAEAQASVGIAATPNIPAPAAPVSVGQTNVPSSLTILNVSTGAEAALTVTVDAITLVPSCGSTIPGADCPLASVDPDVFSVSAIGVGRAGTSCAGIAFSILDVDAVQDKYEFVAPSPVVLGPATAGGSAARCTIDFTVSILKAPALDARVDLPGLQTSNHAAANGTASDGQPGSATGTNITQIDRATPTIATIASTSVPMGSSMNDSAVVSGRVSPVAGATITFTLFGPGDVTCTGVPAFVSTVPYPAAPGSVTSAAFTPTAPGTYRWRAAYAGDANNNAVAGACNDAQENTVVMPSTPTIATNASPNIVLGAGTLTDTAVVTGRVNPTAGATVTFHLFGPGDVTCSGVPLFVSTKPYPAAPGSVTSAAFTPTAAGTYRWRAFYSGDANNSPASGGCGDPNESVIVSPMATPMIATNASANTTIGSAVLTDTATVAGRVNPVAGATVQFRLYDAGDVTCSGVPVFSSSVAYPATGGPVTSAPYTPNRAGTYRWIARYSGDANNAPASGSCGDPNEQTVVARAQPTISTTATALVLLVGSMNDKATVGGRINPVAGATVTFRLYGPADPGCSGAPLLTSTVPYPVTGGAATSAPFTPTKSGTYHWIASYGGDVNNRPVSGNCNDAGESTTAIILFG
jgi:hypothetical protein